MHLQDGLHPEWQDLARGDHVIHHDAATANWNKPSPQGPQGRRNPTGDEPEKIMVNSQ